MCVHKNRTNKKCYNQRCGGNKMLQPKGVEVTKKCYYQKIQLPTYICRLYVATEDAIILFTPGSE